MRRAALIAFAVALVAYLAFAAIPWATKKRDFPASISSPSPRLVVGLAEVPGHGRLCMRDVTVEPRSAQARFRVGTYGKPGPPLDVTLTGRGYHSRARIPAGYPDNQLQQVGVAKAPQAELLTVCVSNGGKQKIALYAAEGLERTRVGTTIDGKPVDVTPAFGFWERTPRAIADQSSLTAKRIALLRGPLGHPWIVWLILVLTVIALTLGIGGALWKAFDAQG